MGRETRSVEQRTALYSIGFYQWYQGPKKAWNIISIILIALIILMSTLGYLAFIGVIQQP